MWMSYCNGCRFLRKGSQNCSIRPCLQWIKSSESQANATVFLAKFYSRVGLLNLNSGPDHLRSACGRIVNSICGSVQSVGFLYSNNWSLFHTGVEAVLKGDPITSFSTDSVAAAPPIKGYDIRHVVKGCIDLMSSGSRVSSNSGGLHWVGKDRSGFKWVGMSKPKGGKLAALGEAVAEMVADAHEMVNFERHSNPHLTMQN